MPIGLDQLVRVERGDGDTFVAVSVGLGAGTRLFGGQVAGQALSAACQTVAAGQLPHSLHAYFLAMARPDIPVRYDVTRSRDGRTFAARHVRAVQREQVIFEMLASFQHDEPGRDWQHRGEPVGPVYTVPVSARPGFEWLTDAATGLDLCPLEGWGDTQSIHPFWFRTVPPVGDDPSVNAAALAYVTDMGLMATAREPGAGREYAVAASIDHAVWFHRPPRTDEWMLYRSEPVAHVGTRGAARGEILTADGQLVATVAQEALWRPVT